MNPLQTALQIIALLETIEPGVQKGIMAIVSAWQSGNDPAVILEGEITSLSQVIAKARAEQGLPPTPDIPDPDPAPAA